MYRKPRLEGSKELSRQEELDQERDFAGNELQKVSSVQGFASANFEIAVPRGPRCGALSSIKYSHQPSHGGRRRAAHFPLRMRMTDISVICRCSCFRQTSHAATCAAYFRRFTG